MTDEAKELVVRLEALAATVEQVPVEFIQREKLASMASHAASLIRSLSERNEKLEGALSDLLLRLDNKIALAPRIHRAYGHAYVLCAGIEACIKASNARAALERK